MKTPRTDAAEWDYYEDCTPEDNMVVLADFARQLETELQSMTALADRLAEALASADTQMKSAANSIEAGLIDEALFYVCSMPRHRKEALTAYDNSKKIIS